MITYNIELDGEINLLKEVLEEQRLAFNYASIQQFPEKANSLVILHSKTYKPFRKAYPNIKSQIVIKAEQEVLACYRTLKSNKKHPKTPVEKKNLSLRLDIRLCSKRTKTGIRITTNKGRKDFSFNVYPKVQELLEKYQYQDPMIFEKEGKIYISLTFDNQEKEIEQKLALGVDLGMRRIAATSEGQILIDKKFNKEKRKLLYQKRCLQSKNTKSAKKILHRIKNKEKNKNKNQVHLVVNEILKTKADTIVLEDLKGIKTKKDFKNKRAISQVPFYEIRRVLAYKAENMGKHILLVRPYYTSQDDCLTGLRDGIRKGCRYYGKSGIVYDADINASINIAKKSNLPISQGKSLTYGQAYVNRLQGRTCRPHDCKSFRVI